MRMKKLEMDLEKLACYRLLLIWEYDRRNSVLMPTCYGLCCCETFCSWVSKRICVHFRDGEAKKALCLPQSFKRWKLKKQWKHLRSFKKQHVYPSSITVESTTTRLAWFVHVIKMRCTQFTLTPQEKQSRRLGYTKITGTWSGERSGEASCSRNNQRKDSWLTCHVLLWHYL